MADRGPSDLIDKSIRSMVGSLFGDSQSRAFRNGDRVVPVPVRTPKKVDLRKRKQVRRG